MVSLTFIICVICVVVYLILQLILGLYLRYRANEVLITPQILSKKNLTGYYAIVTGSNQGIGYQVAKYLVNHGAHVVLACRNDKRGANAVKSINNQIKTNVIYAGGIAEYMNCDLSKLDSTKSFISNYKNTKYPLHILINNAGLSGRSKIKFSQDGINMVWQINYLSHFLLTYELLPIIINSANRKKEFDCRIVNTSSVWHLYGYIDIDTLTSDKETQIKKHNSKGSRNQYGTSKLAQILHATYLQTEVFTKLNIPISICSIQPGGVRTSIFNTSKWKIHMKLGLAFMYPAWVIGLRNAEQGSRNTIYCAVAPIGKHKSKWGGVYIPGAYHTNMQPAQTKDKSGQSTDPKMMKKLYDYSLKVLNLQKRTKHDYVVNQENKEEYIGAITDDNQAVKDGIIVLTDKQYWFFSIIDSNWKQLSDLNEQQACFDGPNVLVNDDKIYRIGGRNIKSDQCMKHCEYFRLDMDTPRWVRMNGTLNERRCSAGSIFLNGHLLIIGGDDNGDELSSMEEYDFDAMKWNLRASMNKTRNDFGICSISQNELLVIGGHSVDLNSGITGYLDCIEKYNYNLDKWMILNTKLPFGKRARCGAFHWREYKPNSIIIAGGTAPARNVVECLDLEKMKWIKYPNLNSCHWWPKIGTLSTESPAILYVVGQNEKNKLDVVEYLDVRENVKKWNTQNIIPNNKVNKVNGTCWI